MKRWLPTAVRVGVVALLAVWLLRFAEPDKLAAAFARLPAWSVAAALGLGASSVALSALRWRALLRGFGARDLPPLGVLVRVVFVGLFYGTLVPGTIGGDVVRGALSRAHFEQAATSYVIVALERVIGLFTLGCVLLVGLALSPVVLELKSLAPSLLLVLGGGSAALLAVLVSGRLARWWARIPHIERPSSLAVAVGVNLVSHVGTVAVFWVLARGLDLPLTPAALAFAVPLGVLAAAIPIAIAGFGPREAAFVGLLALLDVSKADALALSISYGLVVVALALLGGAIHLIEGRITTRTPSGGTT